MSRFSHILTRIEKVVQRLYLGSVRSTVQMVSTAHALSWLGPWNGSYRGKVEGAFQGHRRGEEPPSARVQLED